MSWGRLSQAERDAAYNNSAAVADSARLVRERNEESAVYRAAHAGHLDLAYGDAERAKWDLYPAGADAPCIVFIHGGYWQMNRREDFAIFAEGFAAKGWSVAMPGYSLAPEATLAQIVSELRAALDWLAAHGPQHGVSTANIVISGWSAGGHLAALLLDHHIVQAGLAISGVFELGPLRDTYLNAKLNLSDEEIAALSPLRLQPISKPLAIAYGTQELLALVNDSRDFHATRAAAHAPGALIPVAGADHFTILRELRRADGELVRAVEALILK
jgi:hypothetical protein